VKSTGIVRNIDELGRLVIPKEIRKKLGINETDPVEIYNEGDKIIISKYNSICHFCGASAEIVDYKEKKICKSCINELLNLND